MYIMAPGLTSVHVMQLDAPGQVTFKQTFDMADGCLQSGIPISMYFKNLKDKRE